jgi:hypothetical protein
MASPIDKDVSSMNKSLFSVFGTIAFAAAVTSAAGASTITASGPIPVASSALALTIMGTPVDFLPLSFTGSGPYAVTSGNDSVVVVKAAQIGWGQAINHPFTVNNSCSTSVVVTTTAADTFTLRSGGGAAVTCAVTFAGGAGQTAVMNYTQTATGNGGNFAVQSHKRIQSLKHH